MSSSAAVVVLGAGLPVVFGGLIGHSLTRQMLDREIRRQAVLREELGRQWRALRAHWVRSATYRCPRCGRPLRGDRRNDGPPE